MHIFSCSQNYVLNPLNFPPRYDAYAKGRVLVEFNTSALNTETPWPVAPFTPALDYWNSPGMLLHSFVLEI